MRIIYHHRTRATDAQRVHILEIVKAFRELGHEVEMAALMDESEPQDPQRDAGEALWKRIARRIPFAYEAVLLGYNVVGLWMLWRRLRARPAGFVYERYSLFNFVGVLAGKLTGTPVVLEVNSPFALEQERDKEIKATGLARWSERWILNAATSVIVVSTPLKKILIESGIAADKITVMANGVNLAHFQPDAGGALALREKLGLGGAVVIGFVGWFRKWHGLTLLVEAFAKAGLAKDGAKLLLIGDGPAMGELRDAVSELGVEDAVVFTGAVAHEEAHRYVDLIDIAVQPAANEYCCPMKILEYMALSKAIVAPRQENIWELLEDGVEAVYFQPGDPSTMGSALQRVLSDPALRKRLGANARTAIDSRGYLWTRNAEAVVRLVEGPAGADRVPSSAGAGTVRAFGSNRS